MVRCNPVSPTCLCGVPRTPETCYPNRKNADGLQRLCKKCDNAVRRKNYSPLPRPANVKPTCTKCANQHHRVEGDTCVECGRKYAPLAPLHADGERRGASAWAMAMNEA